MGSSKRNMLRHLSETMSADLKASIPGGPADLIRHFPKQLSRPSQTKNPPTSQNPPAVGSLSSIFRSAAEKNAVEKTDHEGGKTGKLKGCFSDIAMLQEVSDFVKDELGSASSFARGNPDSEESIAWVAKGSPLAAAQRCKEVSRDRKLRYHSRTVQNNRFRKLMTEHAIKLGTENILQLFSRMAREPNEQDFNSLIASCLERAREAVDEEESVDQVYKAYHFLRSMREKRVPLTENSYGPCLAYLIDLELDQEFLFFSKWIEDGNPEAIPILGYYEMLFFIKINDQDRIRDMCCSVNVEDNEEGFLVAEKYLAALSQNDIEEEILKLVDRIGITRISSDVMSSLFMSLGRLSLESDSVGFLLKLRNLQNCTQDLSLLIFNYVTSLMNSTVEKIISKFEEWHEIVGYQPSEKSVTRLIAYCCENLKVYAALDVVNYMSRSGLNVSVGTFHPILLASERSCYPYLVHPIYLAMCQHNVTLTEDAIRGMINMHVKMKDYEGAFNKLKLMEEAGLKPTTKLYNTIMAGYFREENMPSVMMVLKQMKEADVAPDSETYFYLIFNSKSEQEIEKYKKELELDLYPHKMTKQICMALVHSYAKCGLFENAKQMTLIEGGSKHRNKAKSTLISALASNGQVLEAMKMYEESKKLHEEIEPRTICCLIDHLRKHENFDKLVELLGALKDTSFWFDGCSRVAIHCVQKKDLRSVVDFLMQLKDKSEISMRSFCDKLFIEVAESEPVDMAFGLNLLNAMKENFNISPCRTNLDTLLTACLSAKDSISAWLLWKEYQKACLPYNILTYLRMYQVLLATGDRKSAARMLKKMSKDDPHICFIIKKTRKTFCNTS